MADWSDWFATIGHSGLVIIVPAIWLSVMIIISFTFSLEAPPQTVLCLYPTRDLPVNILLPLVLMFRIWSLLPLLLQLRVNLDCSLVLKLVTWNLETGECQSNVSITFQQEDSLGGASRYRIDVAENQKSFVWSEAIPGPCNWSQLSSAAMSSLNGDIPQHGLRSRPVHGC